MIMPFPFEHLQSIAESSAAHIAASLLEGSAVALSAWFTSRLTRQQDSSARFATWFAALMMIAALPMLNGIALSQSASAPAHSAITLPSQCALYVFAAWALIATLLMSRIALSLVRVRALRNRCVPVEQSQLDSKLRDTLAASSRPVTLCTSSQVQVPTAIGFFHPAVVIPAWLLDDLSADDLNQIVLHELAHLRRRDDWTNLAQQIVKALFFFHPAVWWIEKKISLEREIACDDAVLATTAKPRAYAECLAHLAERTFIRRSLALAQAALGHVRHTSVRVAEILNPNRSTTSKPALKSALVLIALCAAGSTVVASREPQLIAFQNAPTHAQASSAGVSPAVAEASRFRSLLKPIPASFVMPAPSIVRKKANPHPTLRAASKPVAPPAPAPIESAFVFTTGTSMFHLTTASDAASDTQTLFFVVEQNNAGQVSYQIQMWRVTLFHPTQPPAAKIPNKET